MVSVVIPSYNSEKTIEKNLSALMHQSYESEYEIILVDSSSDSTPEIVHEKFPMIRFTHLMRKTDPGTARNLGVEQSKGDLILFIDSDCIAAPDWIEHYVRMHEKTEYAAIGGSVLNGNDPDNVVAWAGYFAEFREFIPEHPQAEVNHIPTCNLSYKASILKSLPGFNPNYYPQEDLEFNYRLRQAGYKILFFPEARVYHHHRETMKTFFVHQKKVGKITSQMLKILPLDGSRIARSIILATVFLPVLPVIKWLKTLNVFLKYNRKLLLKYIQAVIVFGIGLIPWVIGFYSGVISKDLGKG